MAGNNVDLAIRVATQFDGKGLKTAETATTKLSKGVKKLGATLLAAFSVQKITQFGKAAAKAFIEDEKAASQLAIAVKNVGLAFETPRIEQFINGLASISGVADDQLRPSMQKLLQTTGSLTKSQELLTQALDISRGSGIDYETVVSDLSLAYVGQTRGLRKYSLGLTRAELEAMSFSKVQEKLTSQFKGANAAYLETYAGKMGILSNAANEAKESIGKGLVDSLVLISGGGNSIQPLADSMQEFGVWLGDAIYGMGIMIDQLKSLPGGGILGGFGGQGFLKTYSPLIKFLDERAKAGKAARPLEGRMTEHAGRIGNPLNLTRARIESEADKRNKQLFNMKKKQLDIEKKSIALTKAAKTIDLDRIGITAALRGKVSETDRLSLNLQLAILDKNEAAALKLSNQLDAAVKRQNELAALLLATPKAPNPYADWIPPKVDFGGNILGTPVPNFTVPSYVNPFMPDAGFLAGISGQKQPVINVEVIIDGESVRNSSVNSSLSGSFNTVNRTNRFDLSPI